MSVEVSNIARCFSKLDELRDINSIGHHHLKWEINNFKIVMFNLNFGRNNTIRYGQMQVQNRSFGIRGICLITLEP